MVWIAAIVIVLVAAILYWRLQQQAPQLTEKDTIVLADFNNTTGEPVFDATLKQALTVDLEQSPFLNVLSDQKVDEQLGFMGLSTETRLTEDVARKVCQRAGSKALLLGSISQLGSQYVVGVRAINCETGDSLGSEQAEAARPRAGAEGPEQSHGEPAAEAWRIAGLGAEVRYASRAGNHSVAGSPEGLQPGNKDREHQGIRGGYSLLRASHRSRSELCHGLCPAGRRVFQSQRARTCGGECQQSFSSFAIRPASGKGCTSPVTTTTWSPAMWTRRSPHICCSGRRIRASSGRTST